MIKLNKDILIDVNKQILMSYTLPCVLSMIWSHELFLHSLRKNNMVMFELKFIFLEHKSNICPL